MSSNDLRVAPRRHSAFRLWAFRALERVALTLGGRRFYRRWFLAPGRFEVRREDVRVPAAELDGFRIAQLSDLHAGPFLGAGDLVHVVDALNAEGVDLIVFTGDLISRNADEARALEGDLGRLTARLGVLGVFGNHDYHGRRERELAERFAARGVRFLFNEGVHPDPELPLFVLGVEDLEEAKGVDVRAARGQRRAGDVEVLLCHNPPGAPAIADGATALALSGHTHGGQVNLPVIRRLGPGHPGDRTALPSGGAQITSRGLGVVGPPVRVRARPDVVVVTLRGPAVGGAA